MFELTLLCVLIDLFVLIALGGFFLVSSVRVLKCLLEGVLISSVTIVVGTNRVSQCRNVILSYEDLHKISLPLHARAHFLFEFQTVVQPDDGGPKMLNPLHVFLSLDVARCV
jgi:hypothetical protein